MNKRIIITGISAVIVLLGAFGSASNQPSSSTSNNTQTINSSATGNQVIEKTKPACDGTAVTTGCVIDSIAYSTYVYHAEVAEKSHTETVTTYKQEVASYCTSCNDGSYSPSCSTGRGTCSHHGGVAQWNAPRYRNVPEYTSKIIVDAPAQASYYEKIAE